MATATTTTDTKMANPSRSIPPELSPHLWTSPQELSLLTALIHTKPVGLHKHFRMISIHNTLLSSGALPYPDAAPHASRTAGIWAKLGALYDMTVLDEREDAVFADVVEDETGDRLPEEEQYWRDFELPEAEFGSSMWERRIDGDGDEKWSDDEGEGGAHVKRESTVGDSEDLRSSPVGTSGGSARGTRSSGRRNAGQRLADMKRESDVGGDRVKKGKERPKAEDEDTEMGEGDGSDEESNEESGSDGEESEGNRRGSIKSGRARGGRRGRGRRGRRGR